MNVTGPATLPFMMIVNADGRTADQLVDATRTMLQRQLDTPSTGVTLVALGHAGTVSGGHMLSGMLTGPALAVHDALAAIGRLATTPGRTEEHGLPVGPGTVPTTPPLG